MSRLSRHIAQRADEASGPRVALAWQLTQQAAEAARRARWEIAVLAPLIVGVLLLYVYRKDVFGLDTEIRIVSALAMVGLGWAFARGVGRAAGPALFKRLDASTAGTVGFLIRLFFLMLSALVAVRVAGLDPRTLVLGGAITAVVLGLAAQQTLGNLVAGLVLLSARPFRVGERVRLQAGGVAGQIEGVVSSLGLLYTTFTQGEDAIMVPNNVVLAAAVVPLREPAAVDLRARLRPDVRPTEVQALLADAVTVPTRDEPHISVEEIDGAEVIVRVAATPEHDADGPKLADEILEALAEVTRDGAGPARERPAQPVPGWDPTTQEFES